MAAVVAEDNGECSRGEELGSSSGPGGQCYCNAPPRSKEVQGAFLSELNPVQAQARGKGIDL